jgi:ubiquinone biosynthesis protein COQ9
MSANYAAEAELRRAKILAATIGHVPFDGWTWRAVARGTKDAGFAEAEAHLAFPDGIREVASAYSAELNRRMAAVLTARAKEVGAMKVRERVAFAVRARLESVAGEKDALRRLITFMALPENCGLGVKLLWATVDAVWRAVGDRSTDFNFYTKRGLLAGVVASTDLYWLSDRSEDYADTWAFLDRRIDAVIRIGGFPRRVGNWIDGKASNLFKRRERPWAARGSSRAETGTEQS